MSSIALGREPWRKAGFSMSAAGALPSDRKPNPPTPECFSFPIVVVSDGHLASPPRQYVKTSIPDLHGILCFIVAS